LFSAHWRVVSQEAWKKKGQARQDAFETFVLSGCKATVAEAKMVQEARRVNFCAVIGMRFCRKFVLQEWLEYLALSWKCGAVAFGGVFVCGSASRLCFYLTRHV